MCGALCGETRSPSDFTGMDCAIAARIRLLGADAASQTLHQQCLRFTGSPPPYRLADLFDTGAGPAQRVSFGATPDRAFVVEIALYAPGSRPCEDGQPLVGLGRSGTVDLSRPGAMIDVALGCRDACEAHGNVQASFLALEDLSTPVAAPTDLQLGELFPYDSFTATDGVCMAPPLNARQGHFRPFAVTAAGANLDGTWVVDHSSMDGCTVIGGTIAGGRQLACLFDDATSKVTLQGFALSADHRAAVRAFNHSVHAQSGALAVRVIDQNDGDPNMSAIGARVIYAPTSTLSEAEYPQDDSWAIQSPTPPPGTTSLGLGVALFADAPAGPYQVTFSDGSTRIFNAGGADDPDAVTVVVVQH